MEGNGVGSAELVVLDLLDVHIVDPLIPGGVAAVLEPLPHGLDQAAEALAQGSGEDGGGCLAVIGEETRLGHHVQHLSLIDDQGALAVIDHNAGAIGNDIVVAVGVG